MYAYGIIEGVRYNNTMEGGKLPGRSRGRASISTRGQQPQLQGAWSRRPGLCEQAEQSSYGRSVRATSPASTASASASASAATEKVAAEIGESSSTVNVGRGAMRGRRVINADRSRVTNIRAHAQT
ncbi:Protein of unknown function [Cotesia congregata]|uniref:Uncharacterized protein n=1 Tax=Cotesia congregata TaxID=51543 RepID=A0A8J2MMN5_COTCN|nr:Protein of unknown function [Cotesia congregata]